MSSKGIISIREMLAEMERGEVFSCQYVTYNKFRNKGGELKIIEEGWMKKRSDIIRSTGDITPISPKEKAKKPPNHYNNYTRNIRILKNGAPTDEIIKIHPPLVLIYNGMKVVP